MRCAHEDQAVNVCGVVQNRYTQDDKTWIEVLDGSTIKTIRAVLPIAEAPSVSAGATLQLVGNWTSCSLQAGEPKCPTFQASEWRVLGAADPNSFPSKANRNSLDFMRRNPHLRIRTPYYALLARFRSAVISALSHYFDSHPGGPFYQVHIPIITWTDCEGGNEVFSVSSQVTKKRSSAQSDSFFGDRKFLQVSAVFHAEAFVLGLDRIWTLSPCFRAERIDDGRHLAEFWMLEVAENYVESLEEILKLVKDMIHAMVNSLKNSSVGQELLQCPIYKEGDQADRRNTMKSLLDRWDLLLTPEWPKITHADAVELMLKASVDGTITFRKMPRQGKDLTEEHEKYLVDHFKSPVFLTHFPTNARLFSALQSPPIAETNDSSGRSKKQYQTTESFDLLLPGVAEVCSGGLREHRLETMLQVMRDKGFFSKNEPAPSSSSATEYPGLLPNESLESLEWFADLRRWGTAQHGGFGIGFERLLMYLTGVESVRDVVSFPRYPGVCGC